jgi:hypothetical protein
MSQPSGVHTPEPFGTPTHSVPHAMQFSGSTSRRTQTLPHGEYPVLHPMPHSESVQVAAPFAGMGHARSQPPQFAGLVSVSTQVPPQAAVVPGQELVHSPASHTSFTPHGMSQPPQCAALERVSTHAPPHFANPSLQVNVHAPYTHAATPLFGLSHTVSHSPQFDTSLEVSMQLAPSQEEKPLSHSMLHAPSSHMLLPFAGITQASPQPPQLAPDVAKFTQAPLQFSSVPEQSSLHSP